MARKASTKNSRSKKGDKPYQNTTSSKKIQLVSGQRRSLRPSRSISRTGSSTAPNSSITSEFEDSEESSVIDANGNGKVHTNGSPTKVISLKLGANRGKRGQSSIVFTEPPLADGKSVTGLRLEEPPSQAVKSELNKLTKRKTKGKEEVNDILASETLIENYNDQLVDLGKIESDTMVSTDRAGLDKKVSSRLREGKVKDYYAKSEVDLPPIKKRKTLASPVKQSKPVKRLTDLSQTLNKTDVEKLESQSDATTLNNDFCDCCGMTGLFLCCDTCPKSFHFYCLNPPMDESDLPDKWFCPDCIGKNRNIEKPKTNVGIFGKLLNNIPYKNPISFRLPIEIIEAFKGISMDKIGDYDDDSFKYTKSYAEIVKEQEDPLNGLYDASGKPFLCYHCSESGLNNKAIINCDYCSLSWHLDCLDPPMPSVKQLGAKWKCPNHADNIVKQRRKLRDQPLIEVDSSKATKIPEDADVAICNTEDRLLGYLDASNKLGYKIPEKLSLLNDKVQLGNVTYQLKEEDIVLDFIHGSHIRKIEQDKKAAWRLVNLEPSAKDYISSLSQLSHRPLISTSQKKSLLKDLVEVVGDELTAVNGSENLEADELRELLAIKRLIEKKSKAKLLEFLHSE